MSELKTNNKIAIVTGGSRGIGYAIAKTFVEHNIRTIIIARNETALIKASNDLGKLADYRVCDVAQLSEIPDLVNAIDEQYGRIDILVNNAGINLKKPVTEVSDEEYQKIITINQTAVFSLSREVTKIMIRQGKGSILNISSMAAQYGLPNVIAYSASKTAIEGMTRAMAVELSPQGIRVNCIAPGFIETPMSSKALDDDPERKNRVLSRTPMGKLGQPQDIGEAAYFLCSDKANFITGEVICVDGGNSIGF
ncbi:MAG: SDR family oxidoreductase [Candidatus Marinimicrobia bacterium]|nr:SDR family oxidoreductase [Candidatus Neomarinimicrobiota bacterium]